MTTPTACFLLISISSFLGITGCQNKPPAPDPELLTIELLRGDIIMCSGQQFGEVSFSLACHESVKETFDLAISLLHSFEYEEAEKAFVKVMDADPGCAMAYWGVAMSLYPALWAPPTQEKLEKGSRLLNIAASLPQTAREKEYLDAIGAYYTEWEKVDAKTRALRMEKKMEEIYHKHKNDPEAAIFYALTLNATADPTDKTYSNQRKAGSILEPIFQDQPNHPGVAHYLIHSYDHPELAEKALSTARKYATIAPASAHAQHMPSHIFTRLGLWDEGISSNLSSTSSAVCYAESAGYEGHWDEELHGMDYLVYAYLQKGDNLRATEQNDYLKTIKKVYPVNFKGAYAIAAIPARIALENKDWQEAARLELSSIEFPWEQFPWQASLVHFTRALGAAHLGNISQAETEISLLQTLHQQLVDQGNPYEANQVLIQLKASQAWLSFAQGNHPEAIRLMREAADKEDNTTKHPVTPGEILPSRELLGDMLLAMNKAAEALEAYEKDMKQHPNRFNGIYGAAIASRELGRVKEANMYFEKLIKLSESADTPRPETEVAKKAVRKI